MVGENKHRPRSKVPAEDSVQSRDLITAVKKGELIKIKKLLRDKRTFIDARDNEDPNKVFKCSFSPKMDMKKIVTLDGFGVRADPRQHFV